MGLVVLKSLSDQILHDNERGLDLSPPVITKELTLPEDIEWVGGCVDVDTCTFVFCEQEDGFIDADLAEIVFGGENVETSDDV
ncbi:hypothetical protein N9937_00335 [bacterium]|nr:hypothetical protein [bacterium]